MDLLTASGLSTLLPSQHKDAAAPEKTGPPLALCGLPVLQLNRPGWSLASGMGLEVSGNHSAFPGSEQSFYCNSIVWDWCRLVHLCGCQLLGLLGGADKVVVRVRRQWEDLQCLSSGLAVRGNMRGCALPLSELGLLSFILVSKIHPNHWMERVLD